MSGNRDARSSLGPMLLEACVYFILGALSFSTAYLQTNAATVWIPSGYAVGLVIVRGYTRWPAIALGSFALNALVIMNAHGGISTPLAIAIAVPIALGNVGEALLGGYLAHRFAAGAGFFARPRNVAAFALSVVPFAPLSSMGIGVVASHLGGLTPSGNLAEIMLTWYVANAIGILVFAAPAAAVLSRAIYAKPFTGIGPWLEALILTACLIFASQAICGFYLADSLREWPKTYMITPLLFWASFRFGTSGALLSILLVALISVIGTMRGFEAFPAETPSRSLIYLQIFLGVMSAMTLLISAGLAENRDLQTNLEDKVRARTQELDRLLREKEVFTTLVAHDLQSPVYGVRNGLRATSQAIEAKRISNQDLLSALGVMETTCSTLAERVAGLLAPAIPEGVDQSVPLSAIIRKIASAHRLRLDAKDATLRIVGDTTVTIRGPDQVEHILDSLVDNAIKFSPPGVPVEIATTQRDSIVEICVTDQGCGIAPNEVPLLFQPRPAVARAGTNLGAGLGLSLAREQARAIGGDLTYTATAPTGSAFRLVLPA